MGGREVFVCVCVFGRGGGSVEEGRRQFAEVRDGLSQSQQLFVESHGLQLESPDTMAQEKATLVTSLA